MYQIRKNETKIWIMTHAMKYKTGSEILFELTKYHYKENNAQQEIQDIVCDKSKLLKFVSTFGNWLNIH